MRSLIDSHSVIWSVDAPEKLSPTASSFIKDRGNTLVLSAASLWEIAIKVGKGKLPLSLPFRQWMANALAALGLELLPITLDHAERQISLPSHHRDPFDRLIAAQALVEGIPLVSADPIFDAYGVTRIWD
jgi:PIN domain nuclease of toxin-antitoxin system